MENVGRQHLVVILHAILVVRPAVPIHKNSPAPTQGTVNHLAFRVTCQRCNVTFEQCMSFNVEVFTLQCQVQCQWFDWPAGQQTGYKCTGEQDCPLPGGPARGSPLFHHGLFRAFMQMIFLLKFCTWLYLNRYETVLFPFVI